MNFLEALKTKRPMRRKFDDSHTPWVVLGTEPSTDGPVPRFRFMETGERIAVGFDDYMATDWEVM